MNPIKSIESFFRNRKCGRILVALSGGADSVCLLMALKAWGGEVYAFHLNHGIRGAEADRDEEFCRNLCEANNIPFSSAKKDVPGFANEKGLSLEEAARVIRYNELDAEALRISADYIATAHNADDNVETVLFNLVRGCSADGLSGIPRIRGNIIRPLLDCTRKEIEDYLSEVNVYYVTDSTNLEDDYTRNRIRHIVMPVLRDINPSVAASVSRLCDSVEKDKEYFAQVLRDSKDTQPSDLPRALLNRQIFTRYFNETGKHLESIHINEIADFVKSGKCVTIDLPGKYCAYISYGNYFFANREEITPYNVKIVNGINEIKEINAKFFYGSQNVYKLSTSVTVNCDNIVGDLFARQRMPGDKIKVFGVSKDVRKELINKKIPLYLRRSIPVFYDKEGIVYVPFIGADDRVFSKTEQTVLGMICPEMENSYEK